MSAPNKLLWVHGWHCLLMSERGFGTFYDLRIISFMLIRLSHTALDVVVMVGTPKRLR